MWSRDPLSTTSTSTASITAAEIATYSDAQIAALGSNIALLSPAALEALSFGTNSQGNPVGQIETISAAQVAALSAAQVQQIGAAGPGGVATSTALIRWLNVGAWSQGRGPHISRTSASHYMDRAVKSSEAYVLAETEAVMDWLMTTFQED